MTQSEMLVLSMRLQSGTCVKISAEDMEHAASGMLESLLYDHVRREDVLNFALTIRANWGISLSEDTLTGQWTMCKN